MHSFLRKILVLENFKYKCPRCYRNGSNAELACYNCNHRLYLNLRQPNTKYIGCVQCGIEQCGSCPSCGAQITYQCITPEVTASDIIGGIIAIFIIGAIFSTCSHTSSSPSSDSTISAPSQPQLNPEPPPEQGQELKVDPSVNGHPSAPEPSPANDEGTVEYIN